MTLEELYRSYCTISSTDPWGMQGMQLLSPPHIETSLFFSWLPGETNPDTSKIWAFIPKDTIPDTVIVIH